MRLHVEGNRRDDTVESAHVAEEASDRVVVADHRHFVAVSVELLAGQNRERLDPGELEADAARGGRDSLEEGGHFVLGWNERAHHLETLRVFLSFLAKLLQT